MNNTIGNSLEEVLDPTRSFVIEAPAGSGKTTLLIQRLLRLLTVVDRPEQILAITFTVKAAEEMRNRLLNALRDARVNKAVESEIEQTIRGLAQAVLEHDQQKNWHLLDHPARLSIKTIDSLCRSLVEQMPLQSHSALLNITEEADPLYDEAALNVLEGLRSHLSSHEPVAQLLLTLKNRPATFRKMAVAMLGKRDQWKALFQNSNTELGSRLNNGLARLQQYALDRLKPLIPLDLIQELLACMQAIQHHPKAPQGVEWPSELSFKCGEFLIWQALVGVVCTKNLTFRKTVTVREGFEAKTVAKERMLVCLEQLTKIDDDSQGKLIEIFELMVAIPAGEYPLADIDALIPIMHSLHLAEQSLLQLFLAKGQVDYSHIAQAAILGLGDDQAPEELLLKLDYSIRHVLVDEFQDTSQSQWKLLNKLVSGFTPADGRSVFLVGDPMQSIYGFREAQVGLFLSVARSGIQNVVFDARRLEYNRRSQASLVKWFNDTFSHIMKKADDEIIGEVQYRQALTFKPTLDECPVEIQGILSNDPDCESLYAALRIQEHLSADDTNEITVLATAREPLRQVANALQQRGIEFEGVKLVSLAERPLIGDLLALTRCIVEPMDDVGPMALLRAPWCGLSLAEIETLFQQRVLGVPLMDWLSKTCASNPSDTLIRRVAPMVDCVTIAQSEWGSLGLAQVVERAWHRLNGPRVLSDIAQWQDATDYFNALTHWSQAGRVSFDTLTRGLAQLYSNVKPKRPRVRLMTIHAAKGLEWDTVMLVGLGKKNASDESQLLEWQSLSGEQGERGLLVAPFRSKEEGSSVASVIRLLNKKRAEAERKRLWYVAVTRAKRRLILVGRLRIDETTNEPQTIPAHTGCAILWPIIHKSFLENALRSQADVRARFAPSTVPSHPINPTGLYRVVEPINLKDLTSPSPYLVQRGVNAQTNTFDFEWVSPVSRAIGVLVHDIFERMGRGQWLLSTLNAIPESFIGQRLSELGVGLGAVSAATARVRRILAAVATDPKAQWIFNTHHQDSQFEWELMHKSVDGFEIARIDRSFIADDGTRYIIDYKTSDHEGRDLAGFLIQEKDRYRQQLERYGSWVQELEPQRPIKLALYFPVLTQWVDWDFTDH